MSRGWKEAEDPDERQQLRNSMLHIHTALTVGAQWTGNENLWGGGLHKNYFFLNKNKLKINLPRRHECRIKPRPLVNRPEASQPQRVTWLEKACTRVHTMGVRVGRSDFSRAVLGLRSNRNKDLASYLQNWRGNNSWMFLKIHSKLFSTHFFPAFNPSSGFSECIYYKYKWKFI